MNETNNQTSRVIITLLVTLTALFLGFETELSGRKSVALDEEFGWKEYSSLPTNLFLIALLIE